MVSEKREAYIDKYNDSDFLILNQIIKNMDQY